MKLKKRNFNFKNEMVNYELSNLIYMYDIRMEICSDDDFEYGTCVKEYGNIMFK